VAVLLFAAASPAAASSETLRRSVGNILFAPLDIALSPIVAARSIYRNLNDIDDSLGVRLVYPVPGFAWNTGLQIGAGSHAASTTKVFSQGAVEETKRDLDVAIQGDGFFQVSLPDGGIGYTRDGSFRLDAEGNLVNVDGLALEPGITVPPDAISIAIGKDGTVSAVSATDPTSSTTLGQLNLARFPNPAGLSSEGGNVYRETPSSGSPVVGPPGEDGKGALMQRFLERSNVEVVSELVRLIVAQRAYEVNSKAIKTGDEMLSTVNNMTR